MFGRLTWGEAEGKLGAFTYDESAGGCRCTAVGDTHTVNGHSCGACMYVIVWQLNATTIPDLELDPV